MFGVLKVGLIELLARLDLFPREDADRIALETAKKLGITSESAIGWVNIKKAEDPMPMGLRGGMEYVDLGIADASDPTYSIAGDPSYLIDPNPPGL